MAAKRAPGYSATEAMHRAGITRRELDYWDRARIVSPTIATARGSGSQRRYSDLDVACLAAVKRLRGVFPGAELNALAPVVAAVRAGEIEYELAEGVWISPQIIARLADAETVAA